MSSGQCRFGKQWIICGCLDNRKFHGRTRSQSGYLSIGIKSQYVDNTVFILLSELCPITDVGDLSPKLLSEIYCSTKLIKIILISYYIPAKKTFRLKDRFGRYLI